MDINSTRYLYEILPEMLYVVDRNSTSTWTLNVRMSNSNLMLVYDGKAEFICNNNKFQASRGDLIYYKSGDIRKAHTYKDNLMKSFGVDFIYTCPVYIDNEWKFIDNDLPFSFTQKINDEYLFSKLID
ncbi:MAG TPA: AraC family transcriptional regulator, partial [Clostridiaceae bacterium]